MATITEVRQAARETGDAKEIAADALYLLWRLRELGREDLWEIVISESYRLHLEGKTAGVEAA